MKRKKKKNEKEKREKELAKRTQDQKILLTLSGWQRVAQAHAGRQQRCNSVENFFAHCFWRFRCCLAFAHYARRVRRFLWCGSKMGWRDFICDWPAHRRTAAASNASDAMRSAELQMIFAIFAIFAIRIGRIAAGEPAGRFLRRAERNLRRRRLVFAVLASLGVVIGGRKVKAVRVRLYKKC